MKPVAAYAEEWLTCLLSTEPVDHPAIEERIRELYRGAGLAPPQHFLWHASPLEALWTFGALTEDHDAMTKLFAQNVRQKSSSLAKLNAVRDGLPARLGVNSWEAVRAAVGRWQVMEPGAQGSLTLRLMQERTTFLMGAVGLTEYSKHLQNVDPAWNGLQSVERQVFGHFGDGILAYGASRSGAESLRSWLGATPYRDYSLLAMARDEEFCDRRALQAPAAMRAIWGVARSAGVWWPFANAVVLAERPVSVTREPKGEIRMSFSDGWHAAPYEAPVRKRSAKTGAEAEVLSLELPRDPANRIELLRKYDRALRRYERYVAGEREAVWQELVELGPAVRSKEHAADALAVAYETMTRVRQNVETLVARLKGMRYEFASKPHVAPGAKTWKTLQKLEKKLGPLPLSLRAFYDVVGEVDLMGRHAQVNPTRSTVAADPLVVYGAESAWEEYQSEDEPEEFEISIAPDDLHKADTSGGDPYSIQMPAPVADAVVENETHQVELVPYLRIAFQWGGFPGWENADAIQPAALQALAAGLLEI